MTGYTDKATTDLYQELSTIGPKKKALNEAFISFGFSNERAREFAHHGFLRRVGTLSHCVKTVFDKLPPDTSNIPEDGNLRDATMALQAFVINCFGAIDNLAWVLVEELQIVQKSGERLPREWVGLRSVNKLVRASLSDDFSNKLATLDAWFANLESYRHSLAHRIPLYIPPYAVQAEDAAEYLQLENDIFENAALGPLKSIEGLKQKQKTLCFFRPVMGHSFYEENPTVLFHAQMMADFNTVNLLGESVMHELQEKAACG